MKLQNVATDVVKVLGVSAVGQIKVNPSEFADYLGLIDYINANPEVTIVGGVPISELVIPQALSGLVLPTSVRVSLDYGWKDILVRPEQAEVPIKVSLFKQISGHLIGVLRDSEPVPLTRPEDVLLSNALERIFTTNYSPMAEVAHPLYVIDDVEALLESQFSGNGTAYLEAVKASIRINL